MKIEFTDKQIEILQFSNNNRPLISICEGAVRSGKTWINNVLWNQHVGLQANKNRNFIVTGHTIGSIERNVLKPLYDMFGIDTRLDKHNRFLMWRNIVNCFGADKSDSYKAMTGMTSHGWYGNEITLQSPNTIHEAFERCSGEGYRIFWDTNPDYPEHPIKMDYINHSDDRLSNGNLRIKSWHFELDDNIFLTSEYIENLKKSTPLGMWYDRRIKGLWVAAEGLVYEGWNPNVHVVEPFDIPDDWQRVRGIDWGFVNPFVMLWGAVDHDGRLYIYHEYYVTRTLIKYLARYINSVQGKYSWTVADHDAQDNAEIKQYGIVTKPAQKDVLIGIQKVAERLVVQPDGKPRLMIFRNCPNTRREMGKYCWAERKEGRPVKEEPMKIDDHSTDNIRYMTMELDHPSSFQIYPIDSYPGSL